MSSHVRDLFSEILAESTEAAELAGAYDHPLLILLKQTLTDQQSALDQLVEVLDRQDQPPVSAFQNSCTQVYHANEAAMPFYEAWTRAISWMPDPCESVRSQLGRLMTSSHDKLEEAAQQLKEENGYMAVKYVIPSFYLPATS